MRLLALVLLLREDHGKIWGAMRMLAVPTRSKCLDHRTFPTLLSSSYWKSKPYHKTAYISQYPQRWKLKCRLNLRISSPRRNNSRRRSERG